MAITRCKELFSKLNWTTIINFSLLQNIIINTLLLITMFGCTEMYWCKAVRLSSTSLIIRELGESCHHQIEELKL